MPPAFWGKQLLRAALFPPPVASAHVDEINLSGYEWERGIFYTTHKIATDVVNLFFAWLSSSLFSFLVLFLSFLLLFASFVRYRLASEVAALWYLGWKTLPACCCPFSSSSRKPVAPARSYLEVAGASRIQGVLGCSLGTTPRHSPHSLCLFGGYAMHYVIPYVSRKLLSMFSLAFCTYFRCFAHRNDCTPDKTRARCAGICVFYPSDFTWYFSWLFAFIQKWPVVPILL